MKAALTLALAVHGAALACGAIDEPTRAFVERMAQNQGLPEHLLTALVWTESNFCPRAVSSAGAIGYGQLMPATARGMHVNPYDAQQNIWGAAHHLRQQWDTFHDWPKAIAAYNAGPGAVQKFGGIPPFAETQRYVTKVLGTYAQLVATFAPKTTPTPMPARANLAGAQPSTTPMKAVAGTLKSGVQAVSKPRSNPSWVNASASPKLAPSTPTTAKSAGQSPAATDTPTGGFLVVRLLPSSPQGASASPSSFTVIAATDSFDAIPATPVSAQSEMQDGQP